MKKNIYLFILFCGIVTFFIYTNVKDYKYLPGLYTYELPNNGIYQELLVNEDLTFKQFVYSANKEKILYQNDGKMMVDGNSIVLKNWLECYEIGEQKVVKRPYVVGSFSGPFFEVFNKGKDVYIILFDQTNYIFRRHR